MDAPAARNDLPILLVRLEHVVAGFEMRKGQRPGVRAQAVQRPADRLLALRALAPGDLALAWSQTAGDDGDADRDPNHHASDRR